MSIAMPIAHGRLPCCGTDLKTQRVMALRWDPDAACTGPGIFPIESTDLGDEYMLDEGMWFQTDAGRIIMF